MRYLLAAKLGFIFALAGHSTIAADLICWGEMDAFCSPNPYSPNPHGWCGKENVDRFGVEVDLDKLVVRVTLLSEFSDSYPILNPGGNSATFHKKYSDDREVTGDINAVNGRFIIWLKQAERGRGPAKTTLRVTGFCEKTDRLF